MKIPMPNIRETLDELYSSLHQERRAEINRRIHTLVLIKEGKSRTRKAVAKYFGVHRNTIRDWLIKYESDGLTALPPLSRGSPGAPSGQRSLPKDVLTALSERLKDTAGFDSYVQLQTWLATT